MIINKESPLCIIYGGKSGEHEVSLRSAASIIRKAPYKDDEIILVGVSKSGKFYLQKSSLVTEVRKGSDLSIGEDVLLAGLPQTGLMNVKTGKEVPIGIIFPIIHGTTGEDGVLQGFLETCGLPYIGSGILGSALGMDKEKVKHVWGEAGLPVVPYRLLRKSLVSRIDFESLYFEICDDLKCTHLFIKPSRGGSSVGIGLAKNAKEFAVKLAQSFQFDTKALIEKAIQAREIEISVMGNDKPRSFVCGEVIPLGHEFYDYESKYLDPNGSKIVIPAPISQELVERIKPLAERAYITCEARGFSRVDFFLDKETDELYLNEINTLPGFTSISMFPMMCEAGGLAYAEIISNLVLLGFEEFHTREGLTYSI